jgi:hypothetical protein
MDDAADAILRLRWLAPRPFPLLPEPRRPELSTGARCGMDGRARRPAARSPAALALAVSSGSALRSRHPPPRRLCPPHRRPAAH